MATSAMRANAPARALRQQSSSLMGQTRCSAKANLGRGPALWSAQPRTTHRSPALTRNASSIVTWARPAWRPESARATAQSFSGAFSTSAPSQQADGSSSSSTKTIRHPTHPTGVYFHLLPELSSASKDWKDSQSSKEGERSSTWAVSLLPTPPSNIDAASIMGYIRVSDSAGNKDGTPPSGHVEDGAVPGGESGDSVVEFAHAHPAAFQPNPSFLELLHKTLREECVEKDELLKFEAATRTSGWAHVNDGRELLMPGRQAWPENIIASIAFTDGELRVRDESGDTSKGSYQPNDAYRLLTAQDGFIQLKETWLEKVRQRCEQHN
ncbi:hypothetical protein OC845_002684 [Tilletia horrida]|nr:hypothetical protein OC845_002684 [Tilletia horrida]